MACMMFDEKRSRVAKAIDEQCYGTVFCLNTAAAGVFFIFFYFFFTQVQTPVTLCSGELWSILVVRLAHSGDLRSRLRHVSSAPSVAYSAACSRVVTHPGTDPARRCLTSVI